MTHRGSRSVCVVGIVLAFVGHAAGARADDPTTEQCFSANESAQLLRHSGKLQTARTQLLVCVAKSCPAAVRDDCIERLTEVEKALPTIVFTAKTSADVDLPEVALTMDGAPFADRLDGTALSVDPGQHTFVFTTTGYATVTKVLVIREGVKGRQEAITFAPAPAPVAPVPAPSLVPSPSPSPAPVGPAPSMKEPDAAASDSRGSNQRLLGYILGGVGIVGIAVGTIFGVQASSTYSEASSSSHCPDGPTSCDPTGASGGKDAHRQATIATVSFAAGAALLVGGIVLYITAPKDGGLTLQPTAGPSAAGVRIGRAW